MRARKFSERFVLAYVPFFVLFERPFFVFYFVFRLWSFFCVLFFCGILLVGNVCPLPQYNGGLKS